MTELKKVSVLLYKNNKTNWEFYLVFLSGIFELGMVPRDGIEPPTRGFSIPCSTN